MLARSANGRALGRETQNESAVCAANDCKVERARPREAAHAQRDKLAATISSSHISNINSRLSVNGLR